MNKRIKVSKQTETEVLTKSRRRCCICYGLNQDEGIKKGQIAHLDGIPSNNSIENLAYLCFDHHDEFDSSTRQSKGLTIEEVKTYREELYRKFALWGSGPKQFQLLNFLAYNIDINMLADSATKAAGSVVFYGQEHAIDVLTTEKVKYMDWDLINPHLIVLDIFASWGLLTFEYNEVEENNILYVYIDVEHDPICKKIADVIKTRIDANNKS